jgi:hypothetical protein
MSAPFEALEERLLRGGIAPRHVKRYLRELNEHLSDIAGAQAAAGHDARTAAAYARTSLGTDEELSDAMLKRREFRSLSARIPWVVFGVLPVLALALALPSHMMVLVVLKKLSAPGVVSALEEMLLFAGNFILVPAVVLLSVIIALRQRCSLAWPILSTSIVLFLSPRLDNPSGADIPPGFSALYLSYGDAGEAIRAGITPLFLNAWWDLMAVQLATLAAQYLVILLPLAWLVRRHSGTKAIA